VPLRIVDLRDRALRDRFGAGFALVRPDQHVAWRGDGPPADACGLIDQVRGASVNHPTADDHRRSSP
jgi:hypothetical protein